MGNKIRVSWSEVFKFVSDLKKFCSDKQFDCILAVATFLCLLCAGGEGGHGECAQCDS